MKSYICKLKFVYFCKIMDGRIALLLKFKNVSATSFADAIDVQRSSISHILSGRNKPSLEFIQKVLKAYPEINPEWLVSGKGSMTRPPDLFADTNKNDIDLEVRKKPALETVIDKTEPVKKDNPEKKNEQNMQIKDNPTKTSNRAKDIERVIVFYTDKTFTTYYPE